MEETSKIFNTKFCPTPAPDLSALGVTDVAPAQYFNERLSYSDRMVASLVRQYTRRAQYLPRKGQESRLLVREFETHLQEMLKDYPTFGRAVNMAAMGFYAEMGLSAKTERIAQQAVQNGYPLDKHIATLLIRSYKNGHNYHGLCNLLKRFERADPKVELDAQMYSVLLPVLPSFEMRVKTFHDMVKGGIKPVVIHLNALLSGLRGVSYMVLGATIEELGKRYSIEPDSLTDILLMSHVDSAEGLARYTQRLLPEAIKDPKLQTMLMKSQLRVAPEKVDILFQQFVVARMRITAATYAHYLEAKASLKTKSATPLMESIFREAVVKFPLHAPLYLPMLKQYSLMRNKGAARRLRSEMLAHLPRASKEFSLIYSKM